MVEHAAELRRDFAPTSQSVYAGPGHKLIAGAPSAVLFVKNNSLRDYIALALHLAYFWIAKCNGTANQCRAVSLCSLPWRVEKFPSERNKTLHFDLIVLGASEYFCIKVLLWLINVVSQYSLKLYILFEALSLHYSHRNVTGIDFLLIKQFL